MSDKCIVFGCVNRKGQGDFIGDICAPCFYMLTQGDIKQPSTNFIYTLAMEKRELDRRYVKLQAELSDCQHRNGKKKL